MIRPLPDQRVPVIDPASGRMNVVWYEYFKARDGLKVSDLKDVALSSLANTEVLIWNSSTSKWENGSN